MKPDGFKYWELVLCYVDDVLSVSDSPMRTMKQIKARFKIKDDKIEEPTSYLGAEIGKMLNEDGDEYWSISSKKYCTSTVDNIEEVLNKTALKLPSTCVTPLSSG